MQLLTVFSEQNFRLEDRNGHIYVKGFVDNEVLRRICSPEGVLGEANAFLDRFSPSSSETLDVQLRKELGKDLANFLFISSVIDYGNIGTSENLFVILKELYKRYPFLFRPNDIFWKKLAEMDQSQADKITEGLLLPLSGLFRTDFRKVLVPGWRAIITFLRTTCEGDGANLFVYMTRSLMIDKDDPNALEKVQDLLDADKIDALKDYSAGMPNTVVKELVAFAKELEEYAEANNMPDIENIAQSLSGEASQTLYRLTLS